MAFKDFDDIFDHIGGFGTYQWHLFALVCIYNCILAFNYFSQIFLVLTPPHWCSPSPTFKYDILRIFDVEVTEEDIVRLTIPPSKDGLGFEKCSRYDVNFSQVSSLETLNSTHWPVTTCTYGWSYNFTEYYPSLTSELNWVCDDDWKGPSAQAAFFAGSVIGGPLFGWLADLLGRIPIIVTVNSIGGTFSILCCLSTSFPMFCITRFIVGLTHESDFMIFYILALEYVSPKHRTFMSNVPIMIFLTGSMCLLPWLAKYLANWKLFGITVALPSFIGCFLPLLVAESARWLLSKGKHKEALAVIKNIAKINNKHLSNEAVENFMAYAVEQQKIDPGKQVSWYDLMKSPTLRKRFLSLSLMWVSLYLAYDGYVRLSENVGFDFFLTFTILGAIELPADLLTVFCMETLGRNHTTSFTLILSGIAASTVIFVQKDSFTIILIISTISRFLVTMSMNVGQQYIVEVLPTAGRAQGSGAIHTFGVAAAFLCPYIVYMSKYYHWVPYVIFGVISIAGGILTKILPETLGERLPDSLVDGELAFLDQPLCYNPCRKRQVDNGDIELRRDNLETENRR